MTSTFKSLPDWSSFDDEQIAVINTPANGRLIVEAAPGTGKTAIACARVARLMKEGMSPARILLISFTRTAVTELRERIRVLAKDVPAADAARITTLDSEAWRLRYGFEETEVEKLFGAFEIGIGKARELLDAGSTEVLDYVEGFGHVLIDEAQDLTEDRAHLIISLIKRLASDAGVTIFGDPCQAIYGWTTDDDEDAQPRVVAKCLLDIIDREQFTAKALTRVYRTSVTDVVDLFSRAREAVQQRPGTSAHAAISSVAVTLGEAQAEVLDEVRFGDPKDASHVLVLCRTRVEVLHRSAELLQLGRLHRVRVPGLQPWIHLDVAKVLHAAQRFVPELQFIALAHQAKLTPERVAHLWKVLSQGCIDSQGRLDLHAVRKRLLIRPPPELLVMDGGMVGPTFSTIHASKGREAPHVVIALRANPRKFTDDEEAAEEARVLYVAATRAHCSVLRVQAEFRPSSKTTSGRSFITSEAGVRLEMGLADDIDGLAPFQKAAPASAEHIAKMFDMDGMHEAVAVLEELKAGEKRWAHRVYVPELGENCVGEFSQKLEADLWDQARREGGSAKPPQVIANLFVVGVRTQVLAADDARVDELSEPYRSSGFIPAFVLRGFPFLVFQKESR